YPERTIIGNGISKWAGAGGWRLGSFAFPKELSWLRETMSSVASETYTSVSAPIQYAAVRAYQGGQTIERYLVHVRRILKTMSDRCHRILRDGGVRVVKPQGAYYMFPVFAGMKREFAKRGIATSEHLCDKLLDEAGVAMLPGNAFERPPDELSARMSLVDFDGASALAKSETLPPDQPLPPEFLKENCAHVLEGMEQIVGWLGGH
ncbi:MAG: aminotransferase class I/II-fold pyridoxal phosphate-dependent enzyme, partial [Euryarchaeota archaeon]|nr:aminotransferase class I/II-fold pyridoxal phosphate-dependent enzyme [Euryarchaeota archaeon]